MTISLKEALTNSLIKKGLLTEAQLKEALDKQKEKGGKRTKGKQKKREWKRINPKGWVIEKMKRKHKNLVYGEHYIYLRKGKKFFRKRK